MTERSLNVYENKGSFPKIREQSLNVAENKGLTRDRRNIIENK